MLHRFVPKKKKKKTVKGTERCQRMKRGGKNGGRNAVEDGEWRRGGWGVPLADSDLMLRSGSQAVRQWTGAMQVITCCGWW